jgi:hypothetical protein
LSNPLTLRARPSTIRVLWIHCAGAADPFPARSPEDQCRVNLVVDLDQGVKDHRPAVITIDVEPIHMAKLEVERMNKDRDLKPSKPY